MKTAALAFVTLLPALTAQQAAATGQPFVLEPGTIELQDFVDRCADYLDWNILVTAQEIAAAPTKEIQTQNRIETDRDGCIELLSSMAARAGFVLTELDAEKRLYEIIMLVGPRGREIMDRAPRRSPDEILARPTLRMPVVTVLALKHTNAMVASNALRPFFAGKAGQGALLTIGASGNAGTLLISGLQDQVATAILMVRESDVPAPPETEMPGQGEMLEAMRKKIAQLEKRIETLEKGGAGEPR